MTTLADLKTRIIAEMVRDDLSDDLAAQLLIHIQRACEYYADEKFWFNSIIESAATVAGTATVNVPATMRRVDRVSIPAYYTDLIEVTLGDLDTDTVQSIPRGYAYYNDALKFYPIPDAVYTLSLQGIAQVDAPAVDADTSIWTNQAQDLIVARTKMTLYRGQFRDPEGTQLAIAEVQEVFNKLKRETAKRLETKLRVRDRKQPFDINIG
jgi:uncharacterized protein (DUF885 family)